MPRNAKDPTLVWRADRGVWYIAHGTRRPLSTGESDCETGPGGKKLPGPRARAELARYINALGRPEEPAVGDLLDWRYRDCEVRGVNLDNLRWQHTHLRKHLGHLRPSDLLIEHVPQPGARTAETKWTPSPALQDYMDRRADKPAAMRNELDELRTTLKAYNFHYQAIPRGKSRPPRERFLNEDEARRLLDACITPHLRLWCLIALITGRRKTAILDLTWDRVEWEAGTLDFDDPDRPYTNKRRGCCAVDRHLLAALRDAYQLRTTDYVIEYQGRRLLDIERGFDCAVARAGLNTPGKPRVTPHVLKHTAISWLAKDNHTIDYIADYTQTTEEVVKRIYRKVNPEMYRKLAEGLAARLFPTGCGLRAMVGSPRYPLNPTSNKQASGNKR